MDEGEDTGVLPRCEAGGRSAKEHCEADSALKHGLLDADQGASWKAVEGSYCRTCAVTATASQLKITSGGCPRGQCKMVQVRGVRRPDQFWKNPNRVLVIQDSTDRSGPKDVSGPRPAAGRA